MSEVGGRERTEVRGRRTAVYAKLRRAKEVGGRERTEVGGQMSEVGDRRTED